MSNEIIFERVPNYLKERPQWVLWREEKTKKGKLTKVPYQVNGNRARTDNSDTWTDFDSCVNTFNTGGFSGIGYNHSDDDGIVSVDLDHCFRSGKQLEGWAEQLLHSCKTYAEYSPNDGVHIVGFANKFFKDTASKWKDDNGKEQGLEVRSGRGRYLTFTGNALNDYELSDCSELLDQIYQSHFAKPEKPAKEAKQFKKDEESVREALTFIPAIERSLWLKICMSLKYEDFAFEVFDEWSESCSEKYDADDCLRVWETSKPRGDVNISTLFFHAIAGGYSQSEKIKSIDFITVSELMNMTFSEPRWAIQDILPEGLTILAGPPKIGKSWLALSIALAVGAGSKCLGEFQALQGKVMYCALEDNKRRLSSRIDKLSFMDRSIINDRTSICFSIPRLDEGGLQQLEKWIDSQPDAKLIIIDTFGKFGHKAKGNMNAYDSDYRGLEPLQQLAISRQIAIVLITHLRKQGSNDPFEQVMGSTGVTGVADSIWLLKRARGEDAGTLFISGRDLEEKELALHFESSLCRWSSLGDAVQFQCSSERLDIINYLQEFGPAGPKEVASALNKKQNNVKNLLAKMFKDNQVGKHQDGKYYSLRSSDYLDYQTQNDNTANFFSEASP